MNAKQTQTTEQLLKHLDMSRELLVATARWDRLTDDEQSDLDEAWYKVCQATRAVSRMAKRHGLIDNRDNVLRAEVK